MSNEDKCAKCEKISSSYTVDELGKYYCSKECSKNCAKHCICCWLVNDIKKTKEKLIEEKKKYQKEKEYPGYENSEGGKELKKTIELMEKAVRSREKQLPEFTCLKNDFCNDYYKNKKPGASYEWCQKCGKYISLSVGQNINSSSWKSQDYYIHEKDCQGENKDNPAERERERERETILAYFQQHNIKSIKLHNNKLIIEYDNSQTETKDVNEQELQQINSYLIKLGKNKLSLSDLQQTSNNPTNSPNSNKGLYIGLAIVGVLIIGVIAWLLMRRNKQQTK